MGNSLNVHQLMDRNMWYNCTMEYYSAVKKNEIIKFRDKWMELEKVIPSEAT